LWYDAAKTDNHSDSAVACRSFLCKCSRQGYPHTKNAQELAKKGTKEYKKKKKTNSFVL